MKWLAGYRHPRYHQDCVAADLVAVFAEPSMLLDGAERVGDRLPVLPVLYHLLWRRVLEVELMVSPGFEVLGSGGRPRRLPAGLLDALPPGEAEKVLWWHRHMTELLTGLPADARPERRPVLATIRRPRTWQLARRPRQPNRRR